MILFCTVLGSIRNGIPLSQQSTYVFIELRFDAYNNVYLNGNIFEIMIFQGFVAPNDPILHQEQWYPP